MERIILEINNKTKCSISDREIEDVVSETLQSSGCDFLQPKTVSISMGFISEDEMQELNRNYRKKDEPTDVLSFSNYDSRKDIENEGNQDVFLGEILVCCEDVKKYAKIKGGFFDEELFRVISHGVLHLLGMEHGEAMFSIQDKVAENALNKK